MDRKKSIGFKKVCLLFTLCSMLLAFCLLRSTFRHLRFAPCALLLAMSALLFALSSPLVAEAADKLVVTAPDGVTKNFVVTDTGKVGIGTASPSFKLHVKDSSANTEVMMFNGDTTDKTSRTQFIISNSGYTSNWTYNFLAFAVHGQSYARDYYLHDGQNDNGLALLWAQDNSGVIMTKFAIGTYSNIPMSLFTNNTERMYITNNGNVGIGTTTPQGKLDVNGTIYQSGVPCCADYVFGKDYKLESIEEHAKYMWENAHLKAIPKARGDDNGNEIVEIGGAYQKGIVEELEKAHIYIEQLYKRISDLEAKLKALEK